MDKNQELESLKRGLRALNILANRRSVSVSEVAREMQLPRTTAERIMVTLERERYIQRDPQSKRYGLAPRVMGLAGAYSTEDRLVQVARPLLFDKTRQIGWPLALAVAVGEQMMVRLTTDPATSLGLYKRQVGSEIAMAFSSSGIVHLAFLDDAERDEQIAMLAASDDPGQELARNRRRLDFYLTEARENGFFVGPDMGRERSVSVPVVIDGRARAVLVMMFIARGMNAADLETRFVPQLKALANEIAIQATAIEDASADVAAPVLAGAAR